MEEFNPQDLKKLYKPLGEPEGENNGQVTIIGGSSLFHGAPLLSIKVASRVVGVVFFASPESSLGPVSEQMKSKLLSYIWVPWDEVGEYIKKSDAILIGPGFMRRHREAGENLDEVGLKTKKITEDLLKKFPQKRWVIDAGSLQTMKVSSIPKGAVLTPNQKEFELLFGNISPHEAATKYNCIVVAKGPEAIVSSSEREAVIANGNVGLTKGGTGDVLAGLAVALLAKNEPFLAASSAAFVVQKAAGELLKTVGAFYNADDLADKVPEVLAQS
jgi:hydroxyethylthiazole kinase-like uncharacterized protein yjeF